MNYYLSNTLLEAAKYMAETKCTIRSASNKYAVSKSTLHKYLRNINNFSNNLVLFYAIASVLASNKAQRHIRGGAATKAKYKNIKI